MKDQFIKKDLIVFDLDGTLTETKSNLTPDMAAALAVLLERKQVAVIGGGTFAQFRRQFVAVLDCPRRLFGNLFLFPTTATSFYRYDHGWKKVYVHKLSKADKRAIRGAFREVFKEVGYAAPAKTYGKVIEDRGTQVTFSALGQDVVAEFGEKGIRMKEEWKRRNTPLKIKMAALLQEKLPKLEVHPSAFTSIDITQKGIDKAFGIRQIERYLKIPIARMVFIGDALYENGNDAAAKKTGVMCIAVTGPKETKKIIKKIIKQSSN